MSRQGTRFGNRRACWLLRGLRVRNIGVLRETARCERRVGLTPACVRQLVENGHHILVEREAGAQSHFPDSDYEPAGAQIIFSPAEVTEVIDRSELLVKVARPTRKELERLHMHQAVMAAIVETSRPLLELPPTSFTELQRRVAENSLYEHAYGARYLEPRYVSVS